MPSWHRSCFFGVCFICGVVYILSAFVRLVFIVCYLRSPLYLLMGHAPFVIYVTDCVVLRSSPVSDIPIPFCDVSQSFYFGCSASSLATEPVVGLRISLVENLLLNSSLLSSSVCPNCPAYSSKLPIMWFPFEIVAFIFPGTFTNMPLSCCFLFPAGSRRRFGRGGHSSLFCL